MPRPPAIPSALIRGLLVAGLMAAALAAAPAALAASQYPDFKTLPPRDLRLERTDVSVNRTGEMHNVLRFTNSVWNADRGKLVVHGDLDPFTKEGPALQRIYDEDGTYTER